MTKKILVSFCVLALFSTAFPACNRTAEKSVAPVETEKAVPYSEPLRLALLPILDVLPFYVAEEQGYFAEENIEVRAIPVASALERDQLLQSGEVDW